MNSILSEDQAHCYICHQGESVLAAMERCLANGLGVCLVVDETRRPVAQVTMDELRRALREGRLVADASLRRLLADREALPVDAAGNAALRPALDRQGRLVGVMVDRSHGFVQVARPDLSAAEFRLAVDALLSSWISSTGTYVQQFQDRFAGFVGRRHGIAVSNCTAALHLALTALGTGPGDEVILPDLTFAATANAVIHCGATPVIVDVDPVTWGLSRETVEPALTRRTRAILPVHLYGRPVALTPILELAADRGLHVIEDCAEAIGARHAGRLAGSFGDVACFSFFANKTITTGEGGMCLTDRPALAERIAELRDHGMARDRRYWHERVGYNYRMTNPQAAIGVAQLGRIEDILARNLCLEALYRTQMAELPGIGFPPELPTGETVGVWLVCLLAPPAQRARMIEAARHAGIELRPFFHPLSQMPPYRAFARDCPVSRALSNSGLNLPTSSSVDSGVIARLRDIFWDVLDQAAA